MLLAKVIGTVVATRKDESLLGTKLLVLQPIDSRGMENGSPFVAVDGVGAGAGEIVFYARAREGSMALPDPFAPVDAGITGIIDSIHRIAREKPRGAERMPQEKGKTG